MDRDEWNLINYGLRIASERPVRCIARAPRPSPRGEVVAPPLRELGSALRRACERRGLMPPRVRA